MTTARDVHIPQATIGISPKVIAATISGLVLYLLAQLLDTIPTELEQLANVAGMIAAAYIAPPGAVPIPRVGTPNDELIGTTEPPR